MINDIEPLEQQIYEVREFERVAAGKLMKGQDDVLGEYEVD